MRLYLMRHGETDLNKEVRLQGQVDYPLNELGRQQAREAGVKMKKAALVFDRIYSSTLDRAIETAVLATGAERDRIIKDERLMEIDYGPYDTVRLEDIGPEAFDFFRDPVHVLPPKGIESIQALSARVGSFLETLKTETRDLDNVLVVTHGVAMRAIFGCLLQQPGTAVWSMPIDNCELFYADCDGTCYQAPVKMSL